MLIDITQDGYGKLEQLDTIPKELSKWLFASVNEAVRPVALAGRQIKALFQPLPGDGFCVWFSRYWADRPIVLRASGDIPVLELRIALKNTLRGEWEKMPAPELPAHYFQLGYTPYVSTVARFEGPAEYQTFDIHFDLSFLQQLGLHYPGLDQFISKAGGSEPAELSKRLHPCTAIMTDCIHHILYNKHSPQGKARLLRYNVELILLEALELTGSAETGKLVLSAADKDALEYVRDTIIKHGPGEYPGNAALVRQATLNSFKFHKGFKERYQTTPYQYHLELRFAHAKKLLLEGAAVGAAAIAVNFEDTSQFIKVFKKRFGLTPGQWKKNGR